MARLGPLAPVLVFAALLVVPVVHAARTTTHSGTVAAIDPQGGVLMLDEVGPWRVVQGQTVVTRRTVAITSETKFNTFIRVSVPHGYAGDFLEVALGPDDITPGDFATAECGIERGRLVAVRVTMPS